MNKILTVLAVLLLATTAAAAPIVLEVFFGSGLQHRFDHVRASAGAPSIGTKYYIVDGNTVSMNAAEAGVVTNIDLNGTMAFEGTETGDCVWSADVSGTVVDSNALNGVPVKAGDEIKWSAKPNTLVVIACRLNGDLNVVVA